MLQAHTVYIPNNVTVRNVTRNATHAPMRIAEAVATPEELVKALHYR